ncbi:bifunctional diguanylate cyclase/phosphodiesterase, partial [Clostridium perfringens]
MEGNYNLYIVGLSIAIAILASYSALNITSKISDANGKSKFFWLCGGAMVMGSGIWSMHFVGMLAMHMNMNVRYDVFLTIMSMLVSVVSSFIAFYITMPKNINWSKIAIGGFIMGSGSVTMHYMGMEAMVIHAEISYDPGIWVLS